MRFMNKQAFSVNSIIREDLKNIVNSDLDWEKFRQKTVLISGANGMLASYLVFTLMYLNEIYPRLKIKVIGLCRNPQKVEERFGDLLKNPLLKINYQNLLEEIKIKGRVDYIFHAASLASPQFYAIDPVGVMSPNVFGTKNLLELARIKKTKGFLYVSSGAVYGKVGRKIITEENYGSLDPTDLGNCYAESKRMGENMCQGWHSQYGLPTFVVRLEHTYGPTMDLHNDTRVFAEFVSDIVNHRDIVIKSDGLPVRTFCYISDAVDGFFRILLKGVSGQSYNVSNPKSRISIRGLAKLLVTLFPEERLKVVYQRRKKNEIYLENSQKIRPSLSIEKIAQLGYQSQIGLEEGFKRTIRSFEEK